MGTVGIADVVSNIRPGETVLLEYTPVSSPELLLYLLHRACTRMDIPLLIDDVSDTFPEYITRLEIAGISVESLLEVPVIKVGGSRGVGNVVGRVEVDKYSLDFKYYGEIYEGVIPEKVVCNPVLGIYKLFIARERHEVIRLVRNIATFVGKKSRFAIYFINQDAVERRIPEILPLLEETATTVLRWGVDGGTYRLDVAKAPSPELPGSRILVSFRDIRGT
ncbi:hypothetical protein E3E36_04305 [Thermococcus sp. M36]|uniref:DUF257 family protein n=1 Tax=Thermococcus sp. M36 TaxID=1638261 RepID=UPI001438795A|nr:hypothetical protein [Thermococcus sp. M36]